MESVNDFCELDQVVFSKNVFWSVSCTFTRSVESKLQLRSVGGG